MTECQHEWVGDSDGVTCAKCGKRLTAEEYRKGLKAEEPKKGRKRK